MPEELKNILLSWETGSRGNRLALSTVSPALRAIVRSSVLVEDRPTPVQEPEHRFRVKVDSATNAENSETASGATQLPHATPETYGVTPVRSDAELDVDVGLGLHDITATLGGFAPTLGWRHQIPLETDDVDTAM